MLLQSNAQVSTTTGTGAIKLTNARAFIEEPGQKALLQFGGIVRYEVLLDPGRDIKPGDSLFILSWGPHTIDPTRVYHVYSAEPEGGLGLEVIVVVIGDKVQR